MSDSANDVVVVLSTAGEYLGTILTLTLTLTLTRTRTRTLTLTLALTLNQVGSWTAPFAMAQINTRVVYAAVAPARTPRLAAGPRQAHCSHLSLGLDRRRSVGLLAEAAPAAAARLYSADFAYSERAMAPDEARATKMARASNPNPNPNLDPNPTPNP